MRALEEFVYWVSSFGSGADIDSVCAINGLAGSSQKNADDQDFVLEQVNGDLISVIDIGGARKWIGYRDHGKMTANFGKSLEALLKSGSGGQHSFSMGFRSDPGQADDVAGRLLEPMVKTARTFGIKDIRTLQDMPDILTAEVDINDFTDVAGLIANTDLVLSVDTAIAHLTASVVNDQKAIATK